MATLDLDDELSIDDSAWFGRFVTAFVLLLIIAIVGGAIWYFQTRGEDSAVRATEDVTVGKSTINSTLVFQGTADAQLNSNLVFQSPGKVAAVNVRIGDVVKQGQVLAALESDDLANAVESAQANAVAVQLRLADLLDGSSAADIATSEQAVAQAQATLTKARNDFADLQDGVSDADLASAQQAVSLAESQLATATSQREKLDNTPSEADVATAEAAVASAETALTAAENSAASAANSVQSAAASLKVSESLYCAADNAPAFCTTPATPISGGDAALMQTALGGANASLASGVISANSAYLNAVNAADSADASVTSAENALEAAEQKLSALEDGPSDEDIDAAEAAVASAEAALESAEARLADAEDGADALDLATASAAVAGAEASVKAAEARLAEDLRGPTSNEISQAEQAVRAAQLQVQAAQIRQRDAQIIAPFDGTVASVNISPGEFASGAATEPPIVLLTPDAIVLKIAVNETDYPTVKIDQGGVALFDGLAGSVYPFRVTQIGLSPTVTQGVVTFEVLASITILPDAPRPAPGMNARGQITTGSVVDVLVVPPRAIRRRAAEQIVDVRKDGTVQEVVITTGASDSESVQVLTGLAEGDVVVVPSLSTGPGTSGGGPTPVPTLPGGIR